MESGALYLCFKTPENPELILLTNCVIPTAISFSRVLDKSSEVMLTALMSTVAQESTWRIDVVYGWLSIRQQLDIRMKVYEIHGWNSASVQKKEGQGRGRVTAQIKVRDRAVVQTDHKVLK